MESVNPVKVSNKLLDLKQAEELTGRDVWFFRRAIYTKRLACIKPFDPRGKVYILERDLWNFFARFRIRASGEHFGFSG